MKNVIKLTREITYDDNEILIPEVPPQKVEVTLDGDISLPDLLGQFEQFVKAMGYFPPENAVLDYIDADQ